MAFFSVVRCVQIALILLRRMWPWGFKPYIIFLYAEKYGLDGQLFIGEQICIFYNLSQTAVSILLLVFGFERDY